MNMKEYQEKAQRTTKDYSPQILDSTNTHGILAVLNVAHANATMSETLKKIIFHGHNKYVEDRKFKDAFNYVNAITGFGTPLLPQIPLPDTETQRSIDAVLGIIGESGEVAKVTVDYIHKRISKEEYFKKMKDETGDILWYITAAARSVGTSISEIADMNIAKLAARYPEGFSAENSQNRDTEAEKEAQEIVEEKAAEISVDKNIPVKETLITVVDAFEKVLVKDGKIKIKSTPENMALLQEAYDAAAELLKKIKGE